MSPRFAGATRQRRQANCINIGPHSLMSHQPISTEEARVFYLLRVGERERGRAKGRGRDKKAMQEKEKRESVERTMYTKHASVDKECALWRGYEGWEGNYRNRVHERDRESISFRGATAARSIETRPLLLALRCALHEAILQMCPKLQYPSTPKSTVHHRRGRHSCRTMAFADWRQPTMKTGPPLLPTTSMQLRVLTVIF